jgi:hypothetical protein
MHNLWKNDDKKLERKCDTMKKSSYFLDQNSISYEFWKVKEK